MVEEEKSALIYLGQDLGPNTVCVRPANERW